MSLSSIQNTVVQQYIKNIATQAQQHYQQHTSQQHIELLCDQVFTPPLDGFGVQGLQVYFKHQFCIAWLHDEVLWHSALNYMMKDSIGSALWIGLG